MPVAVSQTISNGAIGKTVQLVRDPKKFYGLNKEKKGKQKTIPWMDLSDDDEAGGKAQEKRTNGVKRKAEMSNGHHQQNGHQRNQHGGGTRDPESTQKHKKRRKSSSQNSESREELNGQDNDLPDSTNGAGPSRQPSTSPPRSTSFGPPTKSTRSKMIQEQRQNLPIAKGKDALIEEIRKNDVTVLLGETGSGKTTQIPQYILESGLARNGTIAITQPRRVAATSLAARVSQEQNTPLGDLVGYAVRFDEKHDEQKTKIKYMTDGMLVREMMMSAEAVRSNESSGSRKGETGSQKGMLGKYSVIIVDEAHERTLRTDLLLAKLKEIQRKRNGKARNAAGKGKGKEKTENSDGLLDGSNPLKIVIMSATIDAEKFSKFFDNAKILYVKGRQHPVKTYHSATSVLDYTDAALRTFFQIHTDSPPGDVLIFLPGQEDIESLQKSIQLFANQLPVSALGVQICTMFAAQDHSQNSKAFFAPPSRMRKCILATNIAETSITIPGIKYVIDTGKCKEKQYLAKASGGGFDTLLTRDITKSSATQRSGRAGREGPGMCFRLYTEQAFNNMSESGEPEILRCSLTSTILNLTCLGEKLEEMDVMDKPDRDSIASALKTLWLLGAIDASQQITPTGLKMSHFPLEPQHSCSIVASATSTYSCTSAILDIISVLSSSSKLFIDVSDHREAVSDARKKFRHSSGDHMTVLNVVRAYRDVGVGESSKALKSARKEWCRKHFLNERALVEAGDIRKQLVEVCRRVGIDASAVMKDDGSGKEREEDAVLRSIAHGLAGNSAFLQPDGSYKQVIGQTIVKIHPGSALCEKKVSAIIYDDLMYTNQIYARGVSAISKSFFSSHPVFNQRKA